MHTHTQLRTHPRWRVDVAPVGCWCPRMSGNSMGWAIPPWGPMAALDSLAHGQACALAGGCSCCSC
eukprot:scaffold6010_cov18-Tisochrysis_lutea.AAC.1